MRASVLFQRPGRLLTTGLVLSATLIPGGSRGQVKEGEATIPEVSFDEEGLADWAERRLAELRSSQAGNPEAEAESSLQEVWALYFWGVGAKKRVAEAEDLLDRIRGAGFGDSSELRALAAALEVLRAKHSRWPPNKLKHLKAGLSVLDQLIVDHPDDPVVRYLRLASCYSLPFFLSQDESVKADLAFLTRYLPDRTGAFSEPVHRLVLKFMLETDLDAPEVRARFERALQSGEA